MDFVYINIVPSSLSPDIQVPNPRNTPDSTFFLSPVATKQEIKSERRVWVPNQEMINSFLKSSTLYAYNVVGNPSCSVEFTEQF